MNDFLNRTIHEQDDIVFIVNKRGEASRLLLGNVQRINDNSIVAVGVDGEPYRIVFSSRSFKDHKLINTIVLNTPQEQNGAVLDFVSAPIKAGCKVAFMEIPSQGFCTSFVLGNVLRFSDQEVTIVAEKDTKQKYSRAPWQIVVVD